MRLNKVMFCWAWPDSVHLIGFKREKTLTLINLLNPPEHEEGVGELRVVGVWQPHKMGHSSGLYGAWPPEMYSDIH